MMEKISNTNKYLVALVAVLMAGVFIAPLWYISLEAPQYPEGLSMYIWVNKITGGTQYDLQNINLLNHYVGMDAIVESSIPELLFMPYILAVMIAGAVITFIFPRKIMVYFGIASLLAAAVAGMYDFWRWEYNYGHHLNPDAPIIIPGMAYQPPLIACKEMLNITACSIPSFGAIFMFASLAVLIYIIAAENKRAKQAQ